MFYYPTSRADLKIWALNLRTQIAIVGPQLQMSAEDIAKVQASIDKLLTDMANEEQAKAEYKRLLGILQNTEDTVGKSLRELVAHLKTHPLYTEEMGRLLQVLSTTTIADLTKTPPVAKGEQSGNGVHIHFKKNGAHAMAVYGRLLGETSFTLLGIATKSPFVDSRPLAKPGVPEVREYYIIATLANVEVGQRSEIISVKFTG